ncbi:hypothetical protein T12_13681 [Trichinella patagoniensis]|uniref:Uncharacterized protein n=1 Tax=Trichinella patagoniensis TaxID=990121 RepID=A0A0V0Z741_9BILA|nr:hypothetical protein T12_13681 [Trichinella patagoniensis]
MFVLCGIQPKSVWAISEQWHKKTPATKRMGNKVRRGKIRATKVDPLERAEQTPPIKGSTGSESAYRDPKTGHNKYRQSNGVVYRTLSMGRRREEMQGVVRESLENYVIHGGCGGAETEEWPLEGDWLKMDAIRSIF